MQTNLKSDMRAVCHSLVSAVLVAVGVQPSLADPVLDQTVGPSTNMFSSSIFNWAPKAQTFTVEIPGTLSEVDVYIARELDAAGPLILALLGTTGGVPDDAQQSLAPVMIPASSVSRTLGWLSVDVSQFGVALARGDVMAIELIGTGSNAEYQWYGDWHSTYAGGSSFSIPTWAPDGSGYALAFRTYMDPVPEPSGWSLLACGLGGLAVVRSARRGGRPQPART